MEYKSITLRIPSDLYKQVVVRESSSVTSYIVTAVNEKVARDREAELAAGFALLAGPIGPETEAWIESQRIAMSQIDG